jgi:glutamine synthetase
VFTPDFIENYIAYKRENEVDPIRSCARTPLEFVLYYDV